MNWVEIDAAALRWNLQQFRRHLGSSALGAVVKSNAYGHGMLEIAALARQADVPWLCVNQLDEALALREAGHDARILVMGAIPLGRLESVVEHDLRPVLYNPASLERLQALGAARDSRVAVHLKVETGTHRQGIAADDLRPIAEYVQRASHLQLEGVTTHFANIEDTTDHRYAAGQLRRFRAAVESLESVVGRIPLRHAACSAATILFPETHFDLARVGISLYGLWPSSETRVSCHESSAGKWELRPLLSWKSRVAQVKRVPADSFVGYGCTHRTTRDSRIAVLPVGYYEGYDRRLSAGAYTLIGGRRAPLIGRVCMNMCMVDVTDIPGVDVEDEVVLIGAQGEDQITAEQLAKWCGTISYEIVSRIWDGLPRIAVGQLISERQPG